MALWSLISVTRAMLDDALNAERTDAMHSLSWKKQMNLSAGPPQADRAGKSRAAATPVTEDELDAYRFRGTPVRRSKSPVEPEPLPVSHPDNDSEATGT
jgi:hypothetical protein